MTRLTTVKLEQAAQIVGAADVDLWLTFVRETTEGRDPVLPLILEGSLVWPSALIVARDGTRVAVVGSFDAEPLRASGDWNLVVPYVKGIREPLLETLDRLVPDRSRRPRIAINWSLDDPKSDGLSHGMARMLTEFLAGSRFEGTCVSAEAITGALRSRKTAEELARIRRAVAAAEEILGEMPRLTAVGRTEREVYDRIQGLVVERGLGFAWDRTNDPIVNSGPDSMIGHGVPSDEIRIEPGHLFHVDFGVLVDEYASDLQRTWWVPDRAGARLPLDVLEAFHAVHGAISAGAAALRVGVEGWRVDDAARRFLTSAGFPEYQHALGHQVGRMAHDGGALLGPRWERYGRTPHLPIEAGQVYTLELGVTVADRGYLGIEEMVAVTPDGIEWLSQRQGAMAVL